MLANNCEDDLDETWGSDFDDDVEEDTNPKVVMSGDTGSDLYEIPDGKPVHVTPLPILSSTSTVPEWLQKVEAHHKRESLLLGKYPPIIPPSSSSPPAVDENVKPQAAVYIENVLLPTRATKDDDSKNFIEALKRKLSQKNLLAGLPGQNTNSNNVNNNNVNSSSINNNNAKPCSGSGNNRINNNLPKSQSHVELERLSSIETERIKKIKESVQKFPWFYRVDRAKAELILENYNADGAFLVRECYHGGPDVPFTLTIRYALRLFHIQIRVRPDAHFALGSAKVNEMRFASIQEMIDTYRKTALQLHTAGKYFGETKLTNPPIVYSFSK